MLRAPGRRGERALLQPFALNGDRDRAVNKLRGTAWNRADRQGGGAEPLRVQLIVIPVFFRG